MLGETFWSGKKVRMRRGDVSFLKENGKMI